MELKTLKKKIVEKYSSIKLLMNILLFLQQFKFAKQFHFLGITFECFHSLYNVFG